MVSQPVNPPQGHALLFYDGTCPWCSGWVGKLARTKGGKGICFAPLNGPTAQRFLGANPPQDTMVLLIPDGHDFKHHTHAQAAFALARLMGGIWAWLTLFNHLPKSFTHRCYRHLAALRHRLPALVCSPPPPGTCLLP
jgi:predicted DCC family thiol-disulfide oxidoreductase YuxK